MEHLSILFFIKKFLTNKKGEAPIYVRITFQGQRLELTTGHSVNPEKWDIKLQQVSGRKEEDRTLNNSFALIRGNIQQKFNKLISDGKTITFDLVREAIQGKTGKHSAIETLLEAFKDHNEKMKAQVAQK